MVVCIQVKSIPFAQQGSKRVESYQRSVGGEKQEIAAAFLKRQFVLVRKRDGSGSGLAYVD